MYSCDDEKFYEGYGYDSEHNDWIQFLNSIKAGSLLKRHDNLQELWIHLRSEEPELLDTFEIFLGNAVGEIDRIQGDKNIALKSKEQSEREVQQIFIDVEEILEEERHRMKEEYEEKYRYELRRHIEAKQRELDDVADRKRGLERQLADVNLHERRSSESIRNLNRVVEELSCREAVLETENSKLQQENKRLHIQLSVSLDNLQRSQELCMRLHEQSENEFLQREGDTFQASTEHEEQATLEIDPLDTLREAHRASLLENKKGNVTPPLARLSTINSEYECDVTPDPNTPSRVFKVIMTGDSNVGKTSLIQRYCQDNFSDERTPTIDITYQLKNITTPDGVAALQIWDTAGQERFRSIPKSFFRNADGIMLVYDVTNEKSMKNVRHWIQSSTEPAWNNTKIMLLGNKMDCKAEVTYNDGCLMAEECGAAFTLVSAKTGENVAEAFECLCRMLQVNAKVEGTNSPADIVGESIELELNAAKRKKKCCW